MPEQVVFRAGNSNVVSIPRSLGSKYGIKSGVRVTVEEVPEVDGVIVRRATRFSKTQKAGVTPEFKKWLKEVLKEDAEILDEMAGR